MRHGPMVRHGWMVAVAGVAALMMVPGCYSRSKRADHRRVAWVESEAPEVVVESPVESDDIGLPPGGEEPPVAEYGPPTSARYGRPGFAVYEADGRLWVFRRDSEAHREFVDGGEPAEAVTMEGRGPEGMTLSGAERETLEAYRRAAGLGDDAAGGPPAGAVTGAPADREGRGPRQSTRYARPGFAVYQTDGRLWVFREGSAAHREYLDSGETAQSVTLVGRGPDRLTLRGADRDVLEAYRQAWRPR